MKYFLLLIFLFPVYLFSQELPDSFKIGDYVEVYDNDSIMIYFNCTGKVVDKHCAEFYRKGRMDSINVNLTGEFIDYFMSGAIALKATIIDDYLNGTATYFYENGNIKSSGNYKQDLKKGVWTYYYENGNKEKVINYVRNYPFVVEYFKKNGNQKVVNGDGEYKGEFYAFLACDPFTIWGEVKDGKMEGKWTMYDPYFHNTIGYEYFERGLFVKGGDNYYSYIDNQKIFINGFCANENLHIEDNILGCPGDKGIFNLEFKGESLHQVFYQELMESFNATLNHDIQNQWLVVGVRVDKQDKLNSVKVKSSINDISTEKIIYHIINSMNDFTAARMDKIKIDFDLFFTIMIRNNKIMIPTNFLYRNG